MNIKKWCVVLFWASALLTTGAEPGDILLEEHFESWSPGGWSVIDNTSGGCVWNSTAWIGRPNYAGGAGAAAVADSDWYGSDTVDTELRTPPLDLTGIPSAVLSFTAAYKDIDPAVGTDHADVDVSVNGGSTWTQLLSWNEPHDPEGPGELVQLSLEPYSGYSNVIIRFRYVSGWDWWWQIDDVMIIETIPGMPDPPESFSARPISETEILLTWVTNAAGNQVMIATNSVPVFGTPTVTYAPGDQIDGGGGVVYVGTATNFLLNSLVPNSAYYFRAWSTNSVSYSFPASVSARTFSGLISSYPYSESFETGFGQWSPAQATEIEWARNTGTTPSSSTGPGQAADGEWYIYTEASGYNNSTALLDAGFNFTSLNHPELSFMYHMYGAAMGTLAVDINDGVWHEGVVLLSGEQQKSMNEPWREATLDMTPYAGKTPVVIRVRGITGNGFYSDCAVDLITVRKQQPNIYFDSVLHSKKDNPDTTVDYSVIMKNYTGSSNECNLTYNSDAWVVTGTESYIFPPGGVVTATVSVAIPPEALAGAVSTGLVTAVSDDGVYTNQVTFVTHCTWYYTAMHEPLDNDPGWNTQSLWEFGVPQGQGNNGMVDPEAGHTGPNVYGYNLNGSYTDSMPAYFLRTTAIDCTGLRNLSLEFWRWLSVESCCDHATIEISNNGTTWHEIWDGYNNGVYESFWRKCTYDISAYADNQPAVYIRWGMGSTDGSVVYPGWNIDDISIGYQRTDIDNTYLVSMDPVSLTCYEFTPLLTAGLYREGETGSAGPAANFQAQLGYGRAGTYPTSSWTWVPAVYLSSDATSDYYQAQSLITMAGELAYCFRFKKGETIWSYADGDGSANGFSIDECGSISATVQPLSGTLLKEQPPRDADRDAMQSITGSNSILGHVDITVMDDLSFSTKGDVYGLRWQGVYSTEKHAGSEKGFSLKIYSYNTYQPNIPGTLLYEEFHDGYASEELSDSMYGIYEYSFVLDTPFHVQAGSTYWFGVQMDISTNTILWGVLLSGNSQYGYPAVVNYNSSWLILDSDLVISLYGTHTNYGVLCGQVTAAHSGQPLHNTSITMSSSQHTWQTFTDTNGWYGVPMPNGVYSVSAAKELYVGDALKGLELYSQAESNRHDFVLTGSTLDCTPISIELTAYKDAVLTNTVVLTNTGPLAIEFSLYLDDLALTSDGSILSGTRKPDVALCGSDSDSRLDDVYDKLRGTRRLNSVTLYNVGTEIPILATLTNYDALLVYQYYGYYDYTEIGNVMHDYAEQGGGIVLMSDEVGYANMYGRWQTSDYILAEYNGISYYSQSRLGQVHDPQHPLMANVSALDYTETGVQPLLREFRPGAELIADWDSGNPLVIAKDFPHTRRVDLGFYPVSYDVTWLGWDPSTDGDTLMANSLIWAARIPPGWISVSTNSGTLQPGETMQIEVIMNAGALSEFGMYGTHLYINGSFVNELPPVQLLLRRMGDPVISTLSSLKFGEVEVGESKMFALSIKNTGDGILTGEVSAISAPFGISGDRTYAVAADEQATMYVYFAPVEEGVYTNVMLLTGGGDAELQLTGTGIPEPMAAVYITLICSLLLRRKCKP